MIAKHLFRFRQFLVYITLLIPFVYTGPTFSSTTNDALNADLIKASFSGNLPDIKNLLEKGADINAKRQDGITALMGASIKGNREVVEFLLAKGADVNVKANFFGGSGKTAYDFALQEAHQEIVKLLIKAGVTHNEEAASSQSTQP